MPTICRFRGIAISMFFDEGVHMSRPHFHAWYGGARASFDALDLTRLAGELPPQIERMIREWGRAHREELLANWELAREGRPLEPIHS